MKKIQFSHTHERFFYENIALKALENPLKTDDELVRKNLFK